MYHTSVQLDNDTLSKINDYRAKLRPIPNMNKAIKDLILKGLSAEN